MLKTGWSLRVELVEEEIVYRDAVLPLSSIVSLGGRLCVEESVNEGMSNFVMHLKIHLH